LRVCGGCSPFFGEEDLGFLAWNLDDVPNATVGQVDTVDEVRKFARQPNFHADVTQAC